MNSRTGVRGPLVLPATDLLVPLPDPRPHMTVRLRTGGRWSQIAYLGTISIAHLVTTHYALNTALTERVKTESPGCPIELYIREDVAGRFEISDGHHRLAEALLAGHTAVDAVIYDYIDDEPYQAPFADLPALHRTMTSADPIPRTNVIEQIHSPNVIEPRHRGSAAAAIAPENTGSVIPGGENPGTQ